MIDEDPAIPSNDVVDSGGTKMDWKEGSAFRTKDGKIVCGSCYVQCGGDGNGLTDEDIFYYGDDLPEETDTVDCPHCGTPVWVCAECQEEMQYAISAEEAMERHE